MGTVTKTIGTASRDYSTMALWEADLDNAAVYAAGDDAVGACYNDSVFDEAVTINGGGTIGLASRTLIAAVGERHNGIRGAGVRIVRTAAGAVLTIVGATIVRWLEIDGNGNDISAMVSAQAAIDGSLSHLLLHSVVRSSLSGGGHLIAVNCQNLGAAGNASVHNLLIWGCSNVNTGSQIAAGVRMLSSGGRVWTAANITVHGVLNNNGTGSCTGIMQQTASVLQNTIAVATGGTTSGEKVDFSTAGTVAYNLSSDATASGTGSLTNKAAANQFVSTVAGFEDLHLKAGADAIDAGTDLGTTPTGVNIDIKGRDRVAMGDVWDIGAAEYVSSGSLYPFAAAMS